MRLELGRRADYAIRACVDLARHHGDGRRKARAIAETMDIPTTYVPQILAELVRAGLIGSTAGRAGGYALARAPERITLLEVVEALEGNILATDCVLRGGPCRWSDMCAVHVPWARAQHALLGSLAETTLGELVEIDAALDAGTYVVPPDVRRPQSGPATAT
ncbi:Rrf2 family transcriptional regulator [Nitriliruptoraceae bacterium ZYF776]|nr:Rrf2 family transcriptional regulator [Profundirhabdus halotolerans]